MKNRDVLLAFPVTVLLSVAHRLWIALSSVALHQVLQPYGNPFLLVRGLHPLMAFLFHLQLSQETFIAYIPMSFYVKMYQAVFRFKFQHIGL